MHISLKIILSCNAYHVLLYIAETPGERGPTTSATDLDVQVCLMKYFLQLNSTQLV